MCKEQPNFAGVEFPTLIYFLHECFIDKGMTTEEASKYFRNELRLDFLMLVDSPLAGQFSVLHVDNYNTLIASISYFKSALPFLKHQLCVLNPPGVLHAQALQT